MGPPTQSLEKRIENREKLHICSIQAIDAEIAQEGYNDDNDLWKRVRHATQNIASRYTRYNDPNIFYEYDLREIWYILFQGAKITDADHPAQDRLASQVLHAREMGVLSRVLPADESHEERKEIAMTADGEIWSDLPFLVEVAMEVWSKAMEAATDTTQRRNLAALFARLASWVSRPISSPAAEAKGEVEEKDQVPIVDLLPAVVAWFQYCGQKLETLSLANQNYVHPTEGYIDRAADPIFQSEFSVSRWLLWKTRLEELSHCGHKETEKLELRGSKIMTFWGGRIELWERRGKV
ncbi:hypothetical protein FQN54_008953 [Arachnomyces sp. PD_36]|nr:hypothetical protein FQN54_008953 [Arachnomyces sp. PD_36]